MDSVVIETKKERRKNVNQREIKRDKRIWEKITENIGKEVVIYIHLSETEGTAWETNWLEVGMRVQGKVKVPKNNLPIFLPFP